MTVGNHEEYLSLHCTTLGKFDIILGMPWLRRHQPNILWQTNGLQFASDYCLKHCLDSPTSTQGIDELYLRPLPEQASATVSPHPETPLELPPNVPACYREYADIFSKKKSQKMPPHRPYDLKIDLVPNAKLPVGNIYPMSPHELKVLKETIDELVPIGYLRSSTSNVSSPCLFVKKKDASLRLCVNYKKLNDQTIKDKYPLPLIPELIDKLQRATIFSKIDLRSAYHLVRIAPGHEYKTAFRCAYGQYEYTVMPFGLTNAPATFQHFMNDILLDLLNDQVAVYLDDIIIYSTDLNTHISKVKQVLHRLRENELYAKPENANFMFPKLCSSGLKSHLTRYPWTLTR
jgi:hypothetical protein